MLEPVAGSRCDVHDLAVDRNGLCIRCRRAAERAAYLEQLRKPRWPVVATAVIALGLLGYLCFGPKQKKVKMVEPRPPVKAAAVIQPDARLLWEQLGSDKPSPGAGVTGGASPVSPNRASPVIALPPPPKMAPAYLSLVRKAAGKVNIEMYYTTSCPVCVMARKWFVDNNIPYSAHDVERFKWARTKMRRLNPRSTIPTFTVGDQMLEGFSSNALCRTVLTEASKK